MVCALFSAVAVLVSAYHLALPDRKLIRPQAIDEAHMVKFDGLSSSPLPEIMDLFTESIVVLSPELRILHGNTASSMFFGEYFQGVSVLQHIHPDSQHKVMEAARSLEAPAKVDTQQETLRTLLSVQYQIKSNPDSPESPDYFWVESRLCRRPPSAAMLNNNGVTLNHSPSCPYELLMVTCRRVPADMVVITSCLCCCPSWCPSGTCCPCCPHNQFCSHCTCCLYCTYCLGYAKR